MNPLAAHLQALDAINTISHAYFIEGRFASTHVDSHREQASLEVLVAMVEAISGQYLPFGLDHDPRIPPVGRIAKAHIEEMGDGHHAVTGIVEVWEASDTADTIAGDGRTICVTEDIQIRLSFASISPQNASLEQQPFVRSLRSPVHEL